MPEKKFKFLIEGGKATAAPPIGPALSPLGVNVLQIIEKINVETAEFRGMRVPVMVTVNTDTKEFSVEVGTPTVAALIAKETGIEKGSKMPGKEPVGDMSFDSLVKVAKLKMPSLKVKSLKAAVKTVIGTCISMGVTIEGKNPKEFLAELESGKYDDVLEKAT